MRTIICFPLVIGLASALLCPEPYQYVDGIGCIRSLYFNVRDTLDNLLAKSRAECAKDGAHLPIIKNQDQNDKFNKLANYNQEAFGVYLVLDVVCNEKTRRIGWIDGTPLDYLPDNSRGLDFDCVTSSNFTVTSDPADQRWIYVSIMDKWYYAVTCVGDPADLLATTVSPVRPTDPPGSDQCGDYSVMPITSDGANPCYKVFTDFASWENAQQQCTDDFGSLITINSADENKFFWRTAVSVGIVNGMHIGAHQQDSGTWAWVDGEVPFDGKTYSNFISAFPIPGGGSCAAMMTESTAAQWINEDCNENEQPFICRRSDYADVPKSCPVDAPKAGEEFYPPGFPNGDIPCEYLLFVSAGKLVELEVLALVAEDGKDFLEILEGSSGPHTIANLTGNIVTPTKFQTQKSNILRVHWKPSGTGGTRGFKIRYNEAEA